MRTFIVAEVATECVLQKKVFLKISQNSQENNCARISFLIKVAALRAQVFSCEFREISVNTLFTEHLLTTATIVLVQNFC